MRTRNVIAVLVVMSAVVVGPGIRAGELHPSGEQILDKYLAALGGQREIAKIRSISARGRYQLGEGPVGSIRLELLRPDRILFRVELPQIGTIARGTDGDVAWSIDPQGGPRILVGDELGPIQTWLARGFSLLPDPAAIASVGEAVEVLGEDGEMCLEVPVELAATGRTHHDCFDPRSGLLVSRRETIATPAGEAEMTGRASGYERFGGLLFATEWTHRVGQQAWSARYESIELDAADPAAFELPPEIRALLEEPGER